MPQKNPERAARNGALTRTILAELSQRFYPVRARFIVKKAYTVAVEAIAAGRDYSSALESALIDTAIEYNVPYCFGCYGVPTQVVNGDMAACDACPEALEARIMATTEQAA